MATDEILEGKQIREYEILDLVGRGGMGAVYRARHIYLDEERAIKVIRGRFSSDKEIVSRFVREARILTRLRHPNLVLLYEFGNLSEDTYFMVMEYIRGESVLQRIRKQGKIPVPEAIRLIHDAALALHHAHEQGIIHRDISPDNLLIVMQESKQEVVKVIDFGIAKALLEDFHTRPEIYLGKFQYSSPERLTSGNKVDHRSDIYSLGVTFYFMLSGVLPMDAGQAWMTVSRILNDDSPPISSHFPQGELPDELNRIIMKSMDRDPNKRYATMLEMAKDLNQFLSPGEAVDAGSTQQLVEMRHELRTRLNTIIGYSEILEEEARDQGIDSFIHDLKKIQANSRHLLWYIGGSIGPDPADPQS